MKDCMKPSSMQKSFKAAVCFCCAGEERVLRGGGAATRPLQALSVLCLVLLPVCTARPDGARNRERECLPATNIPTRSTAGEIVLQRRTQYCSHRFCAQMICYLL